MSAPPEFAPPDPARAAALLELPAVRDILALLAGPGEETRIVGGALRNALLGLDAKDIDFVTTYLPDAVMRIGRDSGWHAVPTGIDHGTVSLVREGQAFEVTTLREDIETDGRRATVRFGRDFEHDAARRDFTINALSMGRDGILHDYFGGAADLAARRVRFIGSPQQRLREDYLRGLRFLRFSAWYGEGKLDVEGFAAVKALRAGFARLSRERVRQEMLLLLKAPQVLPVLAAAETAGLVSEILGLPVDVARLAARLALGGEASALWRLAALAVRCETDIDHLREALRLTNAEDRQLRLFVEGRAAFEVSACRDLFLLGDRYPEVAGEILRRIASDTGDMSGLDGLGRVENPPVFHLTGKDALALGLAAGPAVGEALARAKAAWAKAGCPAGIDAQRAILKSVL